MTLMRELGTDRGVWMRRVWASERVTLLDLELLEIDLDNCCMYVLMLSV